MRPWRSRPHQHAKTGATKRTTKTKDEKRTTTKQKQTQAKQRQRAPPRARVVLLCSFSCLVFILTFVRPVAARDGVLIVLAGRHACGLGGPDRTNMLKHVQQSVQQKKDEQRAITKQKRTKAKQKQKAPARARVVLFMFLSLFCACSPLFARLPRTTAFL